MLASIDFNKVEKDILNLNEKTEVQNVHNIIEVFSLASIMVSLKGFGPLNHLYPKFHQKLQETGLIKTLPEDLQRTLQMFNDLAKKQNLI